MARPTFSPNDAQREAVGVLAAAGMPQSAIAVALGVSEPVLRRAFRQELDAGAVRASARVIRSLFDMATSGRHPGAAIFWCKTRLGWREVQHVEHSGSMDVSDMSTEDLERELAELRRKRALVESTEAERR